MITVPTLILDEGKCRRNIHFMAEKARNNEVVFRPHFKTHVSHEIGEWFREEGVDRITVSSFRMAQYFVEAGWKDILVAFPVNICEIDTINSLAERIRLSLLVGSVYTAAFLAAKLRNHVEVFVKIDFGYHRTGVDYRDTEQIDSIIRAVESSGKMKFAGFLSHAGNSYDVRGRSEILRVHDETIMKVLELKKHFVVEHPGLVISLGDTPTCSVADDFSMIDEIRPGNFVFYDLMQVIIGSCTPEQVAVAMACPVVEVHQERNELVIYGGSVHFSKESVRDSYGRTIYGAVVRNNERGWGEIIQDAVLVRLSQEHGVVSMPPEIICRYEPGYILTILPVHSCITASVMREFQSTEGKIIRKL
jgi:D-serine deaminase-like pyridoxal phosphate-dependent protein